ncbi:MAG: N-acetylglucosamine-6-phosphate deacetylase [Pyrinomonas sp.]|uniref:N-acetylglucosamine-6-phosphate deacetylase n=1 Tax=Pyrinomonas sp. TaxID=2080306 RepID=UPI00331DD4D8
MTDNVSETLLLRRVRLVLPDRVVEGASVLVENGRVARVFEWDQSARADRALDLDGLALLPGFIDVHIHGAMGVDATEGEVEGLRRVARFLVEHGVTAWLPTLVPAPDEDYRRAVEAIEKLMAEQDERAAKGDLAARALGVHYEGPFVNAAQCGALRTRYFRTYTTRSDLDVLPTIRRPGAVHMTTLAPEIEGGIELVREFRRRRWVIAIGHTRADVRTLDEACEAGAHHMTHFMNAMAPLHHRAPGPIGWGLLRDDVSCDVIADGVHLDPLTLRLILKCKTAERLALISDAVAPTGLGDGDYRLWGETITVQDGRTRNERGSIAGSVISMSDAVRMMLSLGTPLTEVARMAATNPARLLGVEALCGTIEQGKRADLVALDEDGRVKLTIVGGKIVWRR